MLELRPGRDDDAIVIAALHESGTGRASNPDLLLEALTTYPSVVAYEGSELVAFAYTKRFGPDVLELLNIHVKSDRRENGLGAKVLSMLEALARPQWVGMVLVNSMGYAAPDKRAATHFYERAGYTCALTTGMSRVFTKNLVDGH